MDLLGRVASSRPGEGRARVWSEAGLERHATGQSLLFGLGGGALLLVLLLALLSGLARRDRWSVRLAAVLGAFLLYDLSVTGLGARWLWPGWPRWAMAAPPVLAALTGLLAIAFSRAYVDSARHHPRLDRLARAVAVLDVGCALAAALGGRLPLAIWAGAPAAALSFVTMVSLGVAAVRRGDGPSRWFLASCLLVTTFGLAYIAAILGALPAIAGTLAGLRPALLAASALLFVGVLVRVEAERRAAAAGLERAVAERTASLQESVGRLEVEVAERYRVEVRLREADERFRVAFETSPDAINLTRLSDGVYLAINEGFTGLTGWTEADVLGRSALALQIWVEPEARDRLVAGLKARGQVMNLETRFRGKDGRIITGLMSARAVELGGVPCLLSITRDISAMRRAEAERDALAEQLRQAQKLEAIGRLAGGVAHDFNNLLTAITTNASLALFDLPAGDPGRAPFEEIQDAAARATSLTRQLLAFSRRQVIAPRPLDLAAQVTGLEKVLRRVLGEDVALEFAAGASPLVLADPGQVEQVVLNLAVNARDAVKAGGRIRVSTADVEVAGEDRAAERAPGRYGAIEVEDDGGGIDPEVLPHIFEPFFTTKRGKGTGLGLSTVYGIATQHGGFVDVDSTPGRGTRFRVCFPVAREPVRPAPPPEAAQPQPGAGETVLLAEDEPSVRDATAALLTRLGYRVLPARDGADALAVAAAHPGRVDLLLTDVVMPGMNGLDLAGRLAVLRPGLAVVYMSGYTQDVLGQAGVLEEGLILVQKPFQPGRLAAALRRALAGAAAQV